MFLSRDADSPRKARLKHSLRLWRERRSASAVGAARAAAYVSGMNRYLIAAGVLLVLIGLAWPWLSKLGLGRLPGDIVIEREGFSLYIPIVTGLLLSAVASLLFWLLRR
jgi:hypothetical protein